MVKGNKLSLEYKEQLPDSNTKLREMGFSANSILCCLCSNKKTTTTTVTSGYIPSVFLPRLTKQVIHVSLFFIWNQNLTCLHLMDSP